MTSNKYGSLENQTSVGTSLTQTIREAEYWYVERLMLWNSYGCNPFNRVERMIPEN